VTLTIRELDLKKGDVLIELKKKITFKRIQDYARVSGDFNPLHVDENFAQNTNFGGIVAHGMLTLAYVSEMMTKFFGEDWLSIGHLDVRFKQPAHPGDELTLSGEVLGIVRRKTGTTVNCDIRCENQYSEPVLIGTCKVRLPRKE
jgi:3-hydroxybutyryl-CoA dehydratase